MNTPPPKYLGIFRDLDHRHDRRGPDAAWAWEWHRGVTLPLVYALDWNSVDPTSAGARGPATLPGPSGATAIDGAGGELARTRTRGASRGS
jgi:hypothetical protein